MNQEISPLKEMHFEIEMNLIEPMLKGYAIPKVNVTFDI